MTNPSTPNIRIPIAVCAAAADVLEGSHQTLDELFLASGAPGPPPELAHHSKWKVWPQRAGNDPNVDSLAVLGNLIEEFMDLPPISSEPTDFLGMQLPDPLEIYEKKKERLTRVLEGHGLRYFRGGRVLPTRTAPETTVVVEDTIEPRKPSTVEELLEIIIRGLPHAMHPLTHRRKGATQLHFESEYDIQDLLHAQLRPWILDIRPEEYTPSYAGSSTRMDFLLPDHSLILEVKRIRDKGHAAKIGNELILDIEHYRRHQSARGYGALFMILYAFLRTLLA
jgi:hypothetical protein